MTQHTPGEWRVQGVGARYEITAPVYGRPHKGKMVALCFDMVEGYNNIHPDELEKNARLIAAAPELLAALKDIIGPRDIDAKHQCAGCGRVYDEPEDTTLAFCPADDCANHIARAAIAKAEGR